MYRKIPLFSLGPFIDLKEKEHAMKSFVSFKHVFYLPSMS